MGRRRTTNLELNLPEGIRPGKTPGTFEVRVSVPAGRAPDGRMQHREVSRTVSGGIREAKKVRAELVHHREKLGGSAGSLANQLEWWFDRIEHDHSPNTMRNYRAYARRYINPALGDRQLRKLTVKDLDDFYDSLRAQGLAPATIRQCHSIIRKALQEAVRRDDIPANPAAMAEPPSLAKREIEPPDVLAYQKIVERAGGRPDGDQSFAVFLRVAAGTGARRAEVCGLRWSDLDPAGRSLLIARTIIENDGRLEVHTTKTKKPRRIALDPVVIDALTGHLKAMNDRALALEDNLQPDAYMFSDSPDGSEPWRPDRVSWAFYRLRTELGLKVRLHDLRHMHVTQLLAAGVDVRTVAGRVGHLNPNMTLDVYAHFIPAADREAADIIGGLLGATGQLKSG